MLFSSVTFLQYIGRYPPLVAINKITQPITSKLFINILEDLKTYYDEYFEKNMDTFNYYSELMLYSVNVEDYLDHLIVQELGSEELEKKFRDINYEIDNMLVNKKTYDEAYIVNLDARIEELKLVNDGYKPVYNIFRMIVETLELE